MGWKNLLKKVEKFIERELKDENNIKTAWRIDRFEKNHNKITSELQKEIHDWKMQHMSKGHN